ncbi:MAG: putative nucleoside transporter YegT [Verrucomicrobia subdivision 3 bacterium]|nr:putative nucleoside transporter YegT [Limisphaerales bacterium]MCS1413276.1 putative nucleoside transporter YegT [Limisphaerales bacterium]
MNINTRILLSVMMFLQFFVWGAWFSTLGAALGGNGLTEQIGGAFGSAPIAAIIAPLFLGLVADRFFNSEKAMGVLHLLGGGLMFLAPGLVASGNGEMLVWIFTGHMLCYMPTLGLSNTIVFTNINDQNKFPALRVWGTIGWIAAGLIVGGLGWSSSPKIFTLAAASGLVLGVFCFFLPATPPPARGKPVNLHTLLMVDAFRMLTNTPFLIFIICSTLICIPLAYYYALTSNYLTHMGFSAAASTMTLGQMSEIFFMILIPIFYRRLGVKMMILIGMLAWIVRYALFSLGASEQVTWMILLGVILHGVCYDFFFVTGFMYTDNKASKEIRGQAQSLLVFFTQGIGMFFGFRVADAKFGSTVTNADDLTQAMPVAEPFTFLESFGKMLSVDKPEIPGSLFIDTMTQWKTFWMFPCIMAVVITVVFLLAFWEKPAKPN